MTAALSQFDAVDYPVLYSFRRCPYAMRARMGIQAAGIEMDFREVVLRNKPEHMVAISPKATVPVVQLPDGEVVDESLDVMLWALSKNDPQNWLPVDPALQKPMMNLIAQADGLFKHHLDRTKYPNRYENVDPLLERERALAILREWDARLSSYDNLFGDRPMLADFAIFPFVRQFANVDRDWFDALDILNLQAWLERHLNSDIFAAIMPKKTAWTPGDPLTHFPFAA